MSTDPVRADLDAVDAANDGFYTAFSALDAAKMREVWAGRREDCCIHPGWAPIHGHAAIHETWARIFASASFMQFQISDIGIEVFGEIARVSCTETLYSVGHAATGGRTLHSRIAATNLFLRTRQGWKLTLHHGSPVSVSYSDGTPDTN